MQICSIEEDESILNKQINTLREDVMNIIQEKHCIHRRYESARAATLFKFLTNFLDDFSMVNNSQDERSLNSQAVKDKIETLVFQCEKVCNMVEKEEDRHAV